MRARTNAARLLLGLGCTFLVAGCAAGASQTAAPAASTSIVTPTIATPAPSPAAAPVAMAPSPPATAPAYDASTAVSIHIESPECVTDTAPTTTYVSGVRQMRDGTRHCRYDAADPRFSGWSDIVVNSDCYLADYSRCVRWGTERIPGPDGDWVGSFLGGQLGGGIRFNYEVLEGTGAYAGWNYVAYMNMAALGGEEWVIDGFISQGPPPLFPAPSAPQDPVYDGSSAVDIHIEEPECVNVQDVPPTTYVNGVRQIRDAGKKCRYDGADPRFSGWSDIVHNADCYSGEESTKCVRWGTERIPGPDGDWVGTYTGGSIGAGSGWRGNFEILEGTGAYEGWTNIVYQDHAALGGQEWVVDGFIYHGPPPPVPPLPSPASE